MPKSAKNLINIDREKIKKFIIKNKKMLIISSIALALILAFFGYRIWLNVHFFLADDLLLVIEPQDMSLSIHYGERPNVTINVDIENSLVCNAFCGYEFMDLSDNAIVDNGTFTSKGIGKKFSRDFELSVDRVGSGQKLYSFEISCNNIRTYSCPTDESVRKRSSFITLNYDLSEYERLLKEGLKGNMTDIVDRLSLIDIETQKLNKRIFELGFSINLNETEEDKERLNRDYNEIILELKNLERVWAEEDYVLLSELFNRSYDERVEGLKQRILMIASKVDSTLNVHNSLVRELKQIDDSIRGSNQTMLFLGIADVETLSRYSMLIKMAREIKIQIKDNSFFSYYELEKEINKTRNLSENLNARTAKLFLRTYIRGSYYVAVEKEKLCSIKSVCMEKTDLSQVILNSIKTDYDKINDVCGFFGISEKNYEIQRNKSEELMKNYDAEKIKNTIEEAENVSVLLAKNAVFDRIRGINVSQELGESFNFLLEIGRANASGGADYGNLTENEVLSLIQLENENEFKEFYQEYCQKKPINLSEFYGEKVLIEEVEDVKEESFSSRIEFELTENYPVCCVFGDCKRCCTSNECSKDESLYPVLFLHGHALNSDNSPHYSLDAFNKIQSRLQEDGYISAGTITPISDYGEINKGEWGLSSRPVSVKGSYYLVSYYHLGSYTISTQKSENIETYAIRLKELIDLVKFRTGKDKVIIVSHSMGGLVARSYLQIFGDGDVHKLIMIASPNMGISGSVSSYCPILGEKKECSDMNENSIFINRVNDPNKIPENTKVYNIVGVGCVMGNKNGDGVAAKENSELFYGSNFYINGTCTGFSNLLHTQILDIDKYPEVYNIISSALKED
jgi:hypothetical protein